MVENNILKTLAEQVEREREAMLKIRQTIKHARERARRETGEEPVDILVVERPVEMEEPNGDESAIVTAESEILVEPTGQRRQLRPGEKIRVFIVEGQVLLSQALYPCLSQTTDIEVVGESEDFVDDIISVIEKSASDVVLVDVNLPSFSGFDLTRRIIECLPGVSVILLTPYNDDGLIIEALKTGIAGYMGNDITGDGVVNNIRRVFDGHRTISRLIMRPAVAQQVMEYFQCTKKEVESLADSLDLQEAEILSCFAHGYSSREIAHKLAVSEAEIMEHMDCVVDKVVVNERL